VGGRGAAGALDQGWETAEAAVDGEPRQRRGSGEVWSSGKKRRWKCKCVKARVSSWGAPGHVSSRERDTTGESRCWQARRPGWRLGRRRRDVEERGEGQRGPGSGGQGAGASRGAKRGGAGAAEARHMAGEDGCNIQILRNKIH
jgi:hypothetical protein